MQLNDSGTAQNGSTVKGDKCERKCRCESRCRCESKCRVKANPDVKPHAGVKANAGAKATADVKENANVRAYAELGMGCSGMGWETWREISKEGFQAYWEACTAGQYWTNTAVQYRAGGRGPLHTMTGKEQTVPDKHSGAVQGWRTRIPAPDGRKRASSTGQSRQYRAPRPVRFCRGSSPWERRRHQEQQHEHKKNSIEKHMVCCRT